MHNNPTPILVLGCGYLGLRAAEAWRAAGRRVFALTRWADRADDLRRRGLEPLVGDVTDPASLTGWPADVNVLYAVGWDRAAGQTMREVYLGGLANVLEMLPTVERFVYAGSTGVYGQTDGEEVDESAPTEPADEAGRLLLDAEHLLRAKLPAAVVLRFAGIYGPGRLLRTESLRRGEPVPGDPEAFLNLIHVEDGVRAVQAAFEKAGPGMVVNVSDGHPVRRRDFFAELTRRLGAPAPRFEGPAERRATNRRVANRRLREGLGVELAYPSYVEGLAASRTEY